MPLANLDILYRRVENSARVVFIHPYDPTFHRACQALEIRGLINFGKNPILVSDVAEYNSWYSDIEDLNADTYAKYAMIVRDFYGPELRAKFNSLFGTLDVEKIPRSIHNPDNYLKGHRKTVEYLLAKYKNTDTPLEFYGSPFPAEAVAILLQSLKANVRGAINNCDRGLAKTRVSLIAFKESGLKKTLVIAPKSARVTTWPTQIKQVDKSWKYSLIDKDNWKTDSTFDVIQWDSLRKMPEEFFEYCKTYDLLMADEFHRASNYGSQRSQAIELIVENIPKIWAMTGTAVRKKPRNIINLLRLMKHPIVDSEPKLEKFLLRYCGYFDFAMGPGRDPFVDKAQNLDELHDLLKDTLFRWEKHQCNLPPKIRHIVEIDLTDAERKEYDGAWDEFKAVPARAAKMMASKKYPFGVVKEKVKHMAAARVKVPHLVEWAEKLQDAGEKWAIFTDNTEVFDMIMKHFGKACVGINGATPDKKRAAAVKRYEEDDSVWGFVGNIIAAGESITLTKGHHLAFCDINRVPSDILQAEDRQCRGGATETCFIYYFLARGTVYYKVFADFIQSKEVVESITARRDANGNVFDAQWVGDIERFRQMNLKGGQKHEI